MGQAIPRLLVIEADAALQTLIIAILDQTGYQLFTALPENYRPVMQHAEPNLVIISCDRYGSDLPGWELASSLRRELPQATLLMLSTDADTVLEAGVSERGRHFAAALRKPFLAEELLELVERCIEQSSHQPDQASLRARLLGQGRDQPGRNTA